MTARVLCIVIGYCFGLFQTSYFLGKAKGIDIRTVGSGNAGTTNALRAFGTKTALLVFAGDCLKCVLAILLTKALFRNAYADILPLIRTWTAFGCILGHNFPFFMQFRGGKGIACTAGLIFSSGLPLTIAGLAAFFAPLLLTHYVSLGSLLLNVVYLTGTIIQGETGGIPMRTGARIELYALIFVIGVLAFRQHRENISRLLSGTERKTYLFRHPEGTGEDRKETGEDP